MTLLKGRGEGGAPVKRVLLHLPQWGIGVVSALSLQAIKQGMQA